MIKSSEIIYTSYIVDADSEEHAREKYEHLSIEGDRGEGKVKAQDILSEEIYSIEEF